MGQELIYTSAPRGLKPGSRGFCTVISTVGINANLAQRLESLSGYRHVFGPQDANARLNPIVFSHLLLVMGGRPYHVLSRIADAGLDYTHRTNKLAHHIVLDVSERVPAGPAWLLRQPGFLATTFDGQPRMLPAGRRLPAGNETPGVCRHWEQLTGDAGWGGVVAEAAASGRKAYLIFRPGMDMLPLLAESLAMLPPEKRWSVTFSTYLTGLPPGVDCQLACVMQGSPEHARVRQTPNVAVIDLCERLGSAPGGEYEDAARSGDMSRLAALTSPAVDQYPLPQTASAGNIALAGDAAVAARSHGTQGGSPPPLIPPTYATTSQLTPQPQRRTFRRKEASKWPSYALLAGVALIVLGGGSAFWLASRGGIGAEGRGDQPRVEARRLIEPAVPADNHPVEPVNTPEKQPAEPAPGPPPPPPVAPPAESTGPPPEEPAESPAKDDMPTPVSPTEASPTEASPTEASPTEAPPAGSPPPMTPTEQPNQENDADKPNETAAPRPTLSVIAGIVPEDATEDQDGWYTVSDLGPLQAQDHLQLSLTGPEKLFLKETGLEPVTVPSSPGEGNANSREWRLMAKSSELATFAVHGQQLRFKWGDRPPGMFEPRSLRNCLLVVTNNGDREPIAKIKLRKPKLAKKVPIGDFLDRKPVPLPVEITDLSGSMLEQLRWEFVPGTIGGNNDLPQVKILEATQPASGPVFTVTIPGEEPIMVSTKNAKVSAPRNSLALSSFPEMKSLLSIDPPWTSSANTPLQKERIDALHKQAQQRLEKAEKDLGTTYHAVNMDNLEIALKHNKGVLQGKQEEQQRLQKLAAGEKLAPETRKKLADLARDIGYLDQLVKDLEFIIQVRSYRERLNRLKGAFDALGRVYVGYRIYLPVGEDADESILLVDGVEDPSEVAPVGDGKDILTPALTEPAKRTSVPDLGDGGGKPSFREPNTTNTSPPPTGMP